MKASPRILNLGMRSILFVAELLSCSFFRIEDRVLIQSKLRKCEVSCLVRGWSYDWLYDHIPF